MTPSPIPADIRRFILASIPSVPHLEAMLLVHQHGDQSWSPAQLAARLYVSEHRAGELLMNLHAAGFLTREGTAEAVYRFAPNQELGDLVRRMDEFYARNLVAVTQLIHASNVRGAQQFADAFKLRKEP